MVTMLVELNNIIASNGQLSRVPSHDTIHGKRIVDTLSRQSTSYMKRFEFMVLWINGAFGSGKSSVAEAISKKVSPSFIYDPEQVGYFLWHVSPDEMKRKGNFQHIDLWREFNYKILKYINENYTGIILVPMTIYIKQYYDEIVGKLTNDGVIIKHYILAASKQTIIDRLTQRGLAADNWAVQHIDVCLTAFETDISKEKIFTDGKSIDEIASEIIELSTSAM